MSTRYGTILLLMFLHSGTSIQDCTANCQLCRLDNCLQCAAGYWGSTCDRKCNVHCLNNHCSQMLSYCEQGCQEGWYGLKCERGCTYCKPGGCRRNRGYCRNGCLPDKCGPGCPCKKDIFDTNHYKDDISDSIPNNIIVAFVIGIVFIVFIVFIFCGYSKCPGKSVDTQGTSRPNARRTASNATTTTTSTSYPSNGRSDVTSPLYANSNGVHSPAYQSTVSGDTNAQTIGGVGLSGTSVLDFPPPYGSLTPAEPPPCTPEQQTPEQQTPEQQTPEQPTPPPTYASLFPVNDNSDAG